MDERGDENRCDQVTALLASAASDPSTAGDLLPLVYEELRALAGSYFARQRSDHTLQPTAVVHDAYVRLVGNAELAFESRAHFFAVAAKAMRHILADHARRKRSAKRGGDWDRVTLSGIGSDAGDRAYDAADVDEALGALAALSPRQAEVVEFRFFGGMSVEQVARILGVGERTVESDWRFARAWLRDRLDPEREREG